VPEQPGQTTVRHAFFGSNNEGMFTLLVDDDAETLRIIDIVDGMAGVAAVFSPSSFPPTRRDPYAADGFPQGVA
jgi:hypothetical protein